MGARTPEEWGAQFQEAMRDGDLDAVLDLYEPEAAFANRDGRVRVGHAALREEFGPLAAARTDFTFSLAKVVQTGDLALLHNEWRTTSPQQAAGHAIEVLRRQPDGRWLLVVGDPHTVPSLTDGA